MVSADSDKIAAPGNSTISAIPGPVYHIARIILGAIFMLASFAKLQSPWDFGRAIYQYEILVGPFSYLISPMTIILPMLELVCGILLLMNRLVRPAAIVVMAMNIIFIVAILSAMIRGLDVECGCGLDAEFLASIVGANADWKSLVRDLIFVGLNIIVLIAPQSGRSNSPE